jgi:hypothetical protein
VRQTSASEAFRSVANEGLTGWPNSDVTSLESTLVEVFILNNLNLFRMNTYEKHRGRGYYG